MASVINWETDLNSALARGQTEHKTILLDFFNPG